MWLLYSGKAQTPVLGQAPVLSPAKRSFLNQKVVEACDANDGLADNQLTNPRTCNFNPASLRCTAGDAATCLTDAELNVLAEGPDETPTAHAKTVDRLVVDWLRRHLVRWPQTLPG